ncbi:MAG: hypothetical protein KDJ73_05745 [Notoacmeibacter sp.]|nr:hypothetical protein [Notoacmeibacter sp.]
MATDSRNLPLNGEILGRDGPQDGLRFGAVTPVEAEDIAFETVVPGRECAAVHRPEPARPAQAQPEFRPGFVPPPHGDEGGGAMRMLKGAGEDRPEGFLARGGGPAFWLGGLVLAASAFWFSGGHALVWRDRAAAGHAGFVIANVASTIEDHGGRKTLRVDTMVENRGGDTGFLPELLLDVHGPDGSVSRYKLGTNRGQLKPGGSHLFSSNLAVPKVGVARVSARLGGKGDI